MPPEILLNRRHLRHFHHLRKNWGGGRRRITRPATPAHQCHKFGKPVPWTVRSLGSGGPDSQSTLAGYFDDGDLLSDAGGKHHLRLQASGRNPGL